MTALRFFLIIRLNKTNKTKESLCNILSRVPNKVKPLGITAKMANRHGLIAGATGTGKTVTLRKMAEAFSDDGVPVFLVDVKGDLSGLVKAGTFSGKVAERIEQFDLGARVI